MVENASRETMIPLDIQAPCPYLKGESSELLMTVEGWLWSEHGAAWSEETSCRVTDSSSRRRSLSQPAVLMQSASCRPHPLLVMRMHSSCNPCPSLPLERLCFRYLLVNERESAIVEWCNGISFTLSMKAAPSFLTHSLAHHPIHCRDRKSMIE